MTRETPDSARERPELRETRRAQQGRKSRRAQQGRESRRAQQGRKAQEAQEARAQPRRISGLQRGYNPPDVYSRELKRETLFYGGFWLIFLAWPVASILADDSSWPLKILGLMSVLGFIVVYIYALTHPRIVFSVSRWVNTLGYTAVLVLLMALVGITGGPGTVTMAS